MKTEWYQVKLINGSKVNIFLEENDFLEQYFLNDTPLIQDFTSSKTIVKSAIVEFEYCGTTK